MIESHSPMFPFTIPKSNRLPPKLFILFVVLASFPFILVVVWSEGPPLSLTQNLFLWLLGFPIVGFLDYLAITRIWPSDSTDDETRMILTAWCVQLGTAMQGSLRLVWWKLSNEEVSWKVIVPVTLVAALLWGAVFSTGLMGELLTSGSRATSRRVELTAPFPFFVFSDLSARASDTTYPGWEECEWSGNCSLMESSFFARTQRAFQPSLVLSLPRSRADYSTTSFTLALSAPL